jgi:hypothetical protein
VTQFINDRNSNSLERHVQALLNLEETVILLQLSKIRQITENEKSRLRYLSGLILKDLTYEIIRLQDKPTSVSFIVEKLLNTEDEFLSSAGYLADLNCYLEKANEIIGTKVTPRQFIKELLESRRTEYENFEKTVLRFLPPSSGLNYFRKIDDNLFGLRIWPPSKLFQIYIQLASEYRIKDPYKKELYKEEAIKLLESGKIDIQDKHTLIQTLRSL